MIPQVAHLLENLLTSKALEHFVVTASDFAHYLDFLVAFVLRDPLACL